MLRIEEITGKISAGPKKYKKIKYRGVSWEALSDFVRTRDGKCLECGSKKNLQADHFRSSCYKYVKQFFNPNKIQTLCKVCHNRKPDIIQREKEGWEKTCFYKPKPPESKKLPMGKSVL